MLFRLWRWLQLLPYRMRPRPTNKRLQKLVAGADRIVIKKGGVRECKAIHDLVALSITDPADVNELSELLKIHEPKQWSHCMCRGDYAIEFYTGQLMLATFSLHHGHSIRYDKWYGDADLAKADALLQFLAEKGLRAPLEEKLEDESRHNAYEAQQRTWLDIAPACFAGYVNNGFTPFPLDHIERELEKEIPDLNERIIRLLRTYACSEKLWSGYPSYEGLTYKILRQNYIEHIIGAYLASDRNYNIRKGLGRFLCDFDSLKRKTDFMRQTPTSVLDELQACFETLSDEEGTRRIALLRRAKELQHGI